MLSENSLADAGVCVAREMKELLSKKMQEIPPIELSYETYSSHKKESVHLQKTNKQEYQIGLLIPKSKKYVAWFTFLGEEDVCILLELNREKQIVNHKIIQVVFDKDRPHLALGTFLYGSLINNHFIIEDVLMYKSFSLRKLCFGQRFAILSHILSDISNEQYNKPLYVSFVLPIMFDINNESVKEKIQHAAYPIHNVQYRSFTKIIPYINYEIYSYIDNFENNTCRQYDNLEVLQKGTVRCPPDIFNRPNSFGDRRSPAELVVGQRAFAASQKPSLQQLNQKSALRSEPAKRVPSCYTDSDDFGRTSSLLPHRNEIVFSTKNTREPYGKERSVFIVSADIQSDIYNLIHVDGKYNTDVAYIPNYKISVFMNSLFRTIKENVNLDTMEESDDEDDFHDIRYDKYVNLTKQLTMECMYHKKFRRWIPLRVIS